MTLPDDPQDHWTSDYAADDSLPDQTAEGAAGPAAEPDVGPPAVEAAGTEAAGGAAARPERTRRTREERLALERERILVAMASGRALGLHERIAWLLNTQPHTRNSDPALQLAYWQTYEDELYKAWKQDPESHYRKLTRLTSIARARAKIQNQHRLFQASPEVRKRRGQLSEEERERFATDTAPSPTITVYADESGKTGATLLVGSVWFVEPRDTLRVVQRVQRWREETGFDGEFHYTDLKAHTLERYTEFIELVLAEAPLISFKHITMPRAGVRSADAGLEVLFYELVRQGIQHEHDSGRAPLPRRLMLWKDEEDEGRGRDLLILAKLREALATASGVHFGGRLEVETCESLNSKSQPLLQLADLYTGSINRTLVRAQTSESPKDRFAEYLLDRLRGLGVTERAGHVQVEEARDVEVRLTL